MTTASAIQKSLPIIEKAAPMVATLLGGPLAGTAVAMLEKLFGTGDVDANILNDPEAEVKLKQADVALRQAELNDIANARAREIEIAKISGTHDWFLLTLALLVVGAFFLSVGAGVYLHIEEANKETMHYLQDTLGNSFMMILSYYFGTSHQERSKKS